MRPILIEFWGLAFPAWTVFFALAALAAFFYVQSLLRLHSNAALISHFKNLFALCYVAGWFGARAMSILVEQLDVKTPTQFIVELFQFGPMTFYGGAIASVVLGIGYIKFNKLSLGFFADRCFPAGVLALGVGRIGCFLNGDDYGLPVPEQWKSAIWANTFPNLADGVARFPVQIEESLFSCVFAACLYFGIKFIVVHKIPYRPGLIACFAIMFSSMHRFGNEFFRADFRGQFFGTGLSTSQGFALIFIVISMVISSRIRWMSDEKYASTKDS